MDILEIRSLMKSKSIFDIPLRVSFYARVSSEKDEQLNSLNNQISYYNDFIKKNKNWTFVNGYIDEGISGISTLKRENFHNMINDAKSGMFDLIITKEISSFARNTVDSINFTRELLSYGVGVFFQNDGINTLDEDSELRLTIMSGIAQDELRKLSSRIKFGHQQSIQKGIVLGNSRIIGYKKVDKKLVIDESQRHIVEELFELYATNDYSMKQIEEIFWNRGYRNYNGNKIAHTTMSNIISNPKYKGYYCGNKVKIVDMFTKKQKFLEPSEWVLYKDETGEIVPAIVSEELWEKANKILNARSLDVKSRHNKCNHKNIFTGILICSHCGKPYYRKDSQSNGISNSKWVCSGKINNGADSCPSFPIYEEEMKKVLFDFFETSQEEINNYIDEYVNIYKNINTNKNNLNQIKSIKDKIELAEKKKSKLLEYNVTGKITDSDFINMNEKCLTELVSLNEDLEALEIENLKKDNLTEKINNLKAILKVASEKAKSNIIDKNFVDEFIDKIYVSIDEKDSSKAILQIKLKNGEATKYELSHSSRTGHIFK